MSSASLLLRQSFDIAQPVQVAAVGLIKHLVSLQLANTLRFFNAPLSSSESEQTPSPLDAILAVAQRTDDVRIKSESSRVLVALVKSLWASLPVDGNSSDKGAERQAAKTQLTSNETVYDVLCELVFAGAKYQILVNEGLTALTILSTSSSDACKLSNSRTRYPTDSGA